jgi:hypothetical protein
MTEYLWEIDQCRVIVTLQSKTYGVAHIKLLVIVA